jgi:UDP-4-amino-4,6-dideoxy-N-acetyl-beta-L-altrosamine transaminase/dTDP-4-dehydrorhamnose reductase
MKEFSPQIVIHTAAWVDVDGCQVNPAKAKESNETLTKLVVSASPKKAKIVYISTEQVFPGNKPYAKESDPTRPINIYGRTKLAGEQIVQKSRKQHLIVRTNFFGWSLGRKKTFGEWLIQSLREKQPIQLFTDFYFTPLYAGLVADRLEHLLKKEAQGVVHLGGRDRVSKYEFGRKLARMSGLSFGSVKDARMDSVASLAPRPKDISLNSGRAEALLGTQSPTLEKSLQLFLRDEKAFKPTTLIKRGRISQSIPYARQSIDASDIRAVTRALKSGFLTQGPEIEAFEQDFANFCGAKYAVACSSATAGLHLSAQALGVGPGDLWWTSPNTFCATADAALRCGAEVDFVDIEWGTYNMNLHLLEEMLKKASKKGHLPKVVAPVHFTGNPIDMEFLGRLSKRYGFRVVEDAAHATGATFQKTPVGSCRWSDLCVFSFHAVKVITTGEGGMVTTNSQELYEKLLLLRTHGISRDPRYRPADRKPPWYYEKLELGNHYRLTDIQAALGRSQLSSLGKFLQRRREIARRYDRGLRATGLQLPRLTPGGNSSWHLYVVAVPENWGAGTRDRLLTSLREHGINANLHYTPVQEMKYYLEKGRSKNAGNKFSSCPIAKRYGSSAVSLPMFPGLKEREQRKVIQEVRAWCNFFRLV